MDSVYHLITRNVQPWDEIVLNPAETVDFDGGIFALVDRLKEGGYKVIEEGREAVVLRLVGDESKDEFDIPPVDNLRVECQTTPSPIEEPDLKRGPAPGPESNNPRKGGKCFEIFLPILVQQMLKMSWDLLLYILWMRIH